MTDASKSAQPGRLAVVYNPVKVDRDALRAVVGTHEATASWPKSLWYETTEEDPGYAVTRKAIADGATVVLAAGGDGTVRAVAEVLVRSDVALALLPAGTGNLLARNLGLTLGNLDHAVGVAFEGLTRAIDVGAIEIHRDDGASEQRAFVVMAGLGLDAKMLANTDDDLKKRVGWLAYVHALANSLRDKNELRFRYQLDGARTRRLRAHTIIVGNCGALPANILLLPDAAIDDGLFDVLLLRPESLAGWLRIIGKVFWENGVLRRVRGGERLMTRETKALRYVKARKLAVALDQPEDIELDGDGFGVAVGFTTWVDAGALKVRVPA